MTEGRTLYAGIDIGSLSTDVVLLDGNLSVIGSAITATGASTRKAAREALEAALLAGGATEGRSPSPWRRGTEGNRRRGPTCASRRSPVMPGERGVSSPARSPSSTSADRTAR